MSFQHVLDRLLEENQHVVGAVFLDDTGETIDIATTEESTYELKVLGAYLGIHLQRLERMLGEYDFGTAQLVHFQVEKLHTYTLPLPEGYHLALVQRTPALVARTARSLQAAADRLCEELFPS